MNSKVLTVAVAAFVLQALCVQSQGTAALDNVNQLDLAGKQAVSLANLAAVLKGSEGLGLAPNRPGLSRGLIDIGGMVRGLQNVLDSINRLIQNATSALLNVVTQAIHSGQAAAQNAINDWNKRLQDISDGAAAFNASLAECQRKNPTLQDVSDLLSSDVDNCVLLSSLEAQVALKELADIGPQSQKLLDNAVQDIADCERFGLLQAVCVAGKLPGLGAQGAGLALNATLLGAKVTGELAVQVPVRSAVCVSSAVANRTVQALVVTDNIRKCVRDSLQATTTVVVPTDASTAAASTDASTAAASTEASTVTATADASSTTTSPASTEATTVDPAASP